MRPAFVLLITLILGSLVHAAEVATDDAGGGSLLMPQGILASPEPSAAARAPGPDRADAGSVDSGDVPTLADYDARMLRDRTRCGYAWRKLRTNPISVRPVRASYDTIRAKALNAGISLNDLNRTYKTFLKNQDGIPNQRFITIIDFTKRSNQRRMFMIDLFNGDVRAFATSAGKSSDPDGDGYATRFSNNKEAGYSSLGCYMVYGTYSGGKFGKENTMMLHGFEPTNDNACARSLIMHPKGYVGQVPGRSNGCFAVHPNDKDEVFGKVSGGLVCAYHDGPASRVTGRRTTPPRKHVRHHARRRHHAHTYGASYAAE